METLDLGISEANARAWVKALRSGSYTQGHGSLVTSKGNYCCLGVYAVAVLEAHPDDLVYRCGIDEIDLDGLPEGYSDIPFETRRKLAEQNDATEFDFHDIADLIEKSI